MSNSGSFIGDVSASQGGSVSESQGRLGDMFTSPYLPKYAGVSLRNRLFSAYGGSTGLAISTIGTSPAFALFNPVGTGVNLLITEVRIAPVSGTIVLGGIVHAVNTNLSAAATTGTAVGVVPAIAGSGATAKATPLSTCTLPANPTGCRVFMGKEAIQSTLANSAQPTSDLVDGQIGLAPGATWSLFSVGSDTSPLWLISVSWVEVPSGTW